MDLTTKILISTAVAYVSGLVYVPGPDPFSLLIMSVPAILFCAVPLLILSRFQFVKSASSRAQTLVCVLACLATMLVTLGFVVLSRA